MGRIADNVKKLRRSRNMTQSRLATSSRIERSVISRIESGKSPTPQAKTLEALADALGVPVEELTDAGDDLNPTERILAMRFRSQLLNLGMMSKDIRGPVSTLLAAIVDLSRKIEDTQTASRQGLEERLRLVETLLEHAIVTAEGKHYGDFEYVQTAKGQTVTISREELQRVLEDPLRKLSEGAGPPERKPATKRSARKSG